MAKPRPFRLTAPVVREPVLHRQIADVLRLEIALPGHLSPDGVVWWSVDMAAYAGVAPGLRTGRGCIAGISDIQLIWHGRAYFVEVKARDGFLSTAQQGFAHSVTRAEALFGVVRDAGEMLEHLDVWGIPRAKRVAVGGRF